jgi:hypothetical protein
MSTPEAMGVFVTFRMKMGITAANVMPEHKRVLTIKGPIEIKNALLRDLIEPWIT